MRTYVNTFSNVTTKVLTYSHLQSLTQGFGLGPEYALHLSGRAFGLPGVLLEGPSGNRHRLTAIFL